MNSKRPLKTKEPYLDFLYRLHVAKYPLGEEEVQLLHDKEYLGLHDLRKQDKHSKFKPKVERKKKTWVRPVLDFTNDVERAADADLIVVDASGGDISVGADLSLAEAEQKGRVQYVSDIKTEDWKISIDKTIDHGQDFYDWITGINKGFQYRGQYHKFNLYKAQATEWLTDKTAVTDFSHADDQVAFALRERQRCIENSLYFLDKYLPFQDPYATSNTGFTQYKSGEGQRILTFLIDSGYNLNIMKCRQMWATTTVFGIMMKDTMLNFSFNTKMITADERKAVATFDEKVKQPYLALNPIIKPSKPSTFAEMGVSWHGGKDDKSPGRSKITIEPPSRNAINSGNPRRTAIDEQGIIAVLSDMIDNWMPTRKQYSHDLHKLVLRGQLIGWGTSDKVENPEFETYYTNCIEAFNAGSFDYAVVPVFFNIFAREGMTMDEYEAEMKIAYSKKGADAEKARMNFHQAYPMTIEDAFIGSAKTVVPIPVLNKHITRIRSAAVEDKVQYGYWTPLLNDKMRITGADWNVCEDMTDFRISTEIYRHPERGWINRYYKGTDPIANATGYSDFASVVRDKLVHKPVAQMAWRSNDPKESFMQSLLMGIYYDPQIPELVERNAGQGYIDFLDQHGYYSNLVLNVSLPRHLQSGGGNPIGIFKGRGRIPQYLITELMKVLEDGDNIWFEKLFEQLKSFIRKPTEDQVDVFKVSDARYKRDDVIDAHIYASICEEIFGYIVPVNTEEKKKKNDDGFVIVMDGNHNPVRRRRRDINRVSNF